MKSVGGCFEAQGFPRTLIQPPCHGIEFGLRIRREVACRCSPARAFSIIRLDRKPYTLFRIKVDAKPVTLDR
jgi:hypothetical protein